MSNANNAKVSYQPWLIVDETGRVLAGANDKPTAEILKNALVSNGKGKKLEIVENNLTTIVGSLWVQGGAVYLDGQPLVELILKQLTPRGTGRGERVNFGAAKVFIRPASEQEVSDYEKGASAFPLEYEDH